MDLVPCFIEDLLLDFASDIGQVNDDIRHNKSDDFASEFAEEELEWISNKDAFPSVDDLLLQHPNNLLSKQQSPISVLESTTTSTTTTGSAGGGIITSCCASLQAPVRKCRSRRLRCQKNEPWWSSKELILKKVKKQVVSRSNVGGAAALGRKCLHCGSGETPQWRAGPMGPKTLCNACGVRFKSGRLVPEYRPANSPTFSSWLHSNSHRKVVEMRKKKEMMGLIVNKPCSVDKDVSDYDGKILEFGGNADFSVVLIGCLEFFALLLGWKETVEWEILV
ncbi:hypothetical protein ACFE04_008686 [Oxalis oulophora]